MTPSAASLSALVLAGGRARRLGGSKALLDVGGSSLLAHSLRLARAVSDDIVLLPGTRGYRVPDARVLSDDPLAPGPLGALLAGLGAARHDWALLLPCDLPFGDAALVAAMAGRAASTGADAILLRDAHGLQPFHGLYRRSLLTHGRSVALRGGRSLMGFLDGVEVETLPAPEAREPGPLFDVDTPDELRLARAHAGTCSDSPAPAARATLRRA